MINPKNINGADTRSTMWRKFIRILEDLYSPKRHACASFIIIT